jgi:hypothetical protein
VAGERWVDGLGALEPGMREGGPLWRTKPKIAPYRRDFGGACKKPSADDSWGL